MENEIRNYANRDKRNSGKKAANHQKLIDELHYRLEFLKKFDKFKSSCETYLTNPSDGHKLNTSMNELASFFQDKCSEFDCQNVKTSNKKSDENLIRIVLDMYAILMEKAQQATSFICKFLESTDNKELPDCFENSQSYLSDDVIYFLNMLWTNMCIFSISFYSFDGIISETSKYSSSRWLWYTRSRKKRITNWNGKD